MALDQEKMDQSYWAFHTYDAHSDPCPNERGESRVTLSLHRAFFYIVHSDGLWITSMDGEGTVQFLQTIPVGALDNDGKLRP